MNQVLASMKAVNIPTWLGIVLAIGGFLISAIPLFIAFIRAYKAKKAASTAAESERHRAEMKEYAMQLMISAEKLYSNVNQILKQQGDTAGELKKDCVLSKLQSYAVEKGYDFDRNFWSQQIDDTIAVTKQINS